MITIPFVRPIARLLVLCVVCSNFSVLPARAEETSDALEAVVDQYSRLQMRTQLAFEENSVPCEAVQCEAIQLFKVQVETQGQRAKALALVYFPELTQRISAYAFEVVDKVEMGAASDAAGHIVVHQALITREWSDDALCFVLLREMGHTLGRHQVSNFKTKLAITALASLLFPAALLVSATSTATQTGTASAVASSLASSATSLLGTEAALAIKRPRQQVEADQTAIMLANAANMDLISVAGELRDSEDAGNEWHRLLNASARYLVLYAESLPVADIP